MVKLPKVEKLREFLRLAQERQSIYLKRQAGEPPPWTTEPVMQHFKLCNFYRQQDRETAILTEKWVKPYWDHPNLWFACCMFRQINWSPTLLEIGFPDKWEPKKVLKTLLDRVKRGEKVYTSAYMIRGPGKNDGQVGPGSKPKYTVYGVLDPVWKAQSQAPWICLIDRNLEFSWKWLKQFNGWGPFTAYEAITDLRHTRYLNQAPDIMTWANPGPGALKGLNLLYERPINTPTKAAQLIEEMYAVMRWMQEARDISILPTLEMRDVEMWTCEYQKIERARDYLAGRTKRCGLELFRNGQPTLFNQRKAELQTSGGS